MKLKKILLLGKDTRLLADVEETLTNEGFNASWYNDIDELRSIDATSYCMIVMWQGIPELEKGFYLKKWQKENPEILLIDALATSVPVAVAQIQMEFARMLCYEPYIDNVTITNGHEPTVQFMVNEDGYFEIKVYTPGMFYGFNEHTIAARHFEKGRYMLPLHKKYFSHKRSSYFMVKDDKNVNCILDLNEKTVARTYATAS